MQSLKGLLIMFCIAIGAALAWHSHSDEARRIIASSSQLAGWLTSRTEPIADSAPGTAIATQVASSPDQQRLNAISVDLDAMRQTVDQIAVTQEQIRRNVDQLTAGQERIAREIGKLEVAEQQNGHKNTESTQRPNPAAPRKPVPPSAQASTPRSPSAPHP